jgi:translation initiation factor 3 subunit G
MTFGENNMNWGDVADDDVMLPPTTKSGPDNNGITTITSYTMKDGKRYKVVKRVRAYTKTSRIPKRVALRRANFSTKFGDCANVGPGPEDGITSVSFDLVEMDSPDVKKKDDQEETLGQLLNWAKGRKWRFKDGAEGGEGNAGAGDKEENENRYVAPHMRGTGRAPMEMRESADTRRDDGHTLRVTNISEDTKEADLQELFRPFGRISRIYLAKDRVTMQSRGFAFVTFLHKEDAEAAKGKLDGYGYDHLILKLEWAQPSKPREETTFRSGYGKALPQNTASDLKGAKK